MKSATMSLSVGSEMMPEDTFHAASIDSTSDGPRTRTKMLSFLHFPCFTLSFLHLPSFIFPSIVSSFIVRLFPFLP
jgi:hypothetical protein